MVLDEADSLLDDSFNVLLRGILKKMKVVRNAVYLVYISCVSIVQLCDCDCVNVSSELCGDFRRCH